MKNTGIVRNLDSLGRIVIPMELRKTLKMDEHQPIEIFVNDSQIILQKYAPGCSLCGFTDRKLFKLYPDKLVCAGCMDIIVRNRDKFHDSALPAEDFGL
ncbi:AbrB/MazE/SpoVT family DNA-binding domain-containing protein [Paenibacillus sp. FSL H8-0168]|uniref:AbrB/MazE/SpoVT family DNA-binding domain-containing protein n=1 Tax=Paenibacillus sp. FSL H8-0168 TaxID=2921378 RepID=UPI0031585BEA